MKIKNLLSLSLHSWVVTLVVAAAAEPDLAGTWKGALDANGTRLRLVFKIRKSADGAYGGTMVSVDQGALDIPISSVSFKTPSAKIEVKLINGAYDATFNKDGSELSGQWRQGGVALPLKLQRSDEPVAKQLSPAELDQNKKTAAKIGGNWEGALEVGAVKLRLVFKVSLSPEGSLSGTLDSIDQGAKDIPISGIVFTNTSVKLEVKLVGGVFDGELARDGASMSGQWKQGGQSLPLKLTRTGKPTVLNRPQEPKKPYPYDEEEVSFENKKAGITLAGTLTRPRSGGPFPAALLITGSGAQDRDEAIFGHRPFLVLADHLTRHGIAVLRVDDRGFGGSTGNFATATTLDFADDTMAGVQFLLGRKEIDHAKIGLIGHSEGALIAPLVANRSTNVAFIVLIAGPGVTGEQILYRQAELISRANGISDELITKGRRHQEAIFAALKETEDRDVVEKKIREIARKALTEMTEEEKKVSGASDATVEGQVKAVLSPWFGFFLTYDPVPALKSVRCPVLALWGERDLQVPPKQNLPAVVGALRAGGRSNFRTIEFPRLNHLLQTCETGSIAEYGRIEETLAPIALETISEWILRQTAG